MELDDLFDEELSDRLNLDKELELDEDLDLGGGAGVSREGG